MRHGRCAERHESETRNHGAEIVSAVEPIFELREITRDMFGAYGSIGSDQRRLDVAQCRVDPLEGGRFGGSRAAPVLIAVWVHPTPATAAKHARPSVKTWASGASAVAASLRIATRLNGVVTALAAC